MQPLTAVRLPLGILVFVQTVGAKKARLLRTIAAEKTKARLYFRLELATACK
jgi:hypothetical protein